METFEAGLYEDPGISGIDALLSGKGYEPNHEFTSHMAVPEGEVHIAYDFKGEGTLIRAFYHDSPDSEVDSEFDAKVSVDAYSGRTDSDIEKARETAETVATEFGGAFMNPQDGTRLEPGELE